MIYFTLLLLDHQELRREERNRREPRRCVAELHNAATIRLACTNLIQILPPYDDIIKFRSKKRVHRAGQTCCENKNVPTPRVEGHRTAPVP